MENRQQLLEKLKRIDHKGYKQYKELRGRYDMCGYQLSIDHVQGDPFASPSRVRLIFPNQHNFPTECFLKAHRKIALEDYLLRSFRSALYRQMKNKGRSGSGKSGMITICTVGQEVLQRTAVLVDTQKIEVRLEVGFPAYGRTIAARELEQILVHDLPDMAVPVFTYAKQNQKKIKSIMELSDDQQYIREELQKRGLVAFVGDGSILPRKSGVSALPLMDAKKFSAPASLAVEMQLPHFGTMRGMGIPEGITVIVGGGYHGKSTLLKAIELGVYNHIAGDGREYVITRDDAVKIRAEEGRSIQQEDISMFINNLPSGQDTTSFSTENASGSTSQAANTIEAIEGGTSLLLIDEDTTATNFMVRDTVMAQLVRTEEEPITPFIQRIQSLSQDLGISSILVVGSSGEYLSVADKVIRMDCYETKDVTADAKALARPYEGMAAVKKAFLKKKIRTRSIGKVKIHGWDTLVLDKMEVDLRYFDQIADAGQTAALAYMMQYALEHFDGTAGEITTQLYQQIAAEGFLSVIPSYYGAGAPVLPRPHEFLSCLLRYRGL